MLLLKWLPKLLCRDSGTGQCTALLILCLRFFTHFAELVSAQHPLHVECGRLQLGQHAASDAAMTASVESHTPVEMAAQAAVQRQWDRSMHRMCAFMSQILYAHYRAVMCKEAITRLRNRVSVRVGSRLHMGPTCACTAFSESLADLAICMSSIALNAHA